MARSGLTDRMVKQAREPGVLIDGKGLRLRVTANAQTGAVRKSWVLRVTVKPFMDMNTMIEERLTQCCVHVATVRATVRSSEDVFRVAFTFLLCASTSAIGASLKNEA